MLRLIVAELRHHIPFTVLGAAAGVALVVIFILSNALPSLVEVSLTIFYTLHPLHVVFSATATTAMYRRHAPGRLLPAIIIGYFGSIVVATLSDSLIPFLGETLLNLPHAEAHIGFVEQWWLVNPAAFLGIGISLWRPHTRLPHTGHVLLSTWASLFHILMALGQSVEWVHYLAIFVFLFLAVWLPVCLSDIAFPLLFTRERVPVDET